MHKYIDYFTILLEYVEKGVFQVLYRHLLVQVAYVYRIVRRELGPRVNFLWLNCLERVIQYG